MITVTEKEHWKQRIARKISQAIAELVDREDPGYLKRVQQDARQAAMKHLGIAEFLDREKAIADQERKLHQDKQELHWRIVAAIRKVSLEEVRAHYCNAPAEWERAVRDRQEVEERQLMATSPLGAVILKLKREEEELLDTVWLATSPKQIKGLWQGVAELVSVEPTALQRQALQDDGAIDA